MSVFSWYPVRGRYAETPRSSTFAPWLKADLTKYVVPRQSRFLYRMWRIMFCPHLYNLSSRRMSSNRQRIITGRFMVLTTSHNKVSHVSFKRMNSNAIYQIKLCAIKCKPDAQKGKPMMQWTSNFQQYLRTPHAHN
jgi:hypothetical protein